MDPDCLVFILKQLDCEIPRIDPVQAGIDEHCGLPFAQTWIKQTWLKLTWISRSKPTALAT
jgi:hypothetical protein